MTLANKFLSSRTSALLSDRCVFSDSLKVRSNHIGGAYRKFSLFERYVNHCYSDVSVRFLLFPLSNWFSCVDSSKI